MNAVALEPHDEKNRLGYNVAVALGVVLVIAAGIRSICFSGVIGSADLAYLEEAHNIADGSPLAEAHPFLNKPGFLYVEALTMKAFGARETAQLAYPFLMSLLGVAVAFVVGWRAWGAAAGVVAGIALALVPVDILYATRVYPDVPAAAFVVASVSAAYFSGRAKSPVIWAAVAGAAAGAAYLHTNAVVIAVPAAVTALAFGISGKRKLASAMFSFIISFAAVAGVEMWRNRAVAGDPLLAWRTTFEPGGDPVPGHILLRRLTADFGNAIFWGAGGLGTVVALGAAGAVFAVASKDRTAAFAVAWLLITLLALNFWPESVRPYGPLPYRDARYFLPLAAPAALLTGRAVSLLLEGAGSTKPVGRCAVSFAFVFFAALLIADGSRHHFWVICGAYGAPLTALVLLTGWIKRKFTGEDPRAIARLHFAATLFIVATAAVSGVALRFFAKPGSGNERWAVETVEEKGITALYTDTRSRRIIAYLSGYSGRLEVVDYAKEAPSKGDYVFINPARYPRVRADGYRIPESAGRVPVTWAEVARVNGREPRVNGREPRVKGGEPRVKGRDPRVEGREPRPAVIYEVK